MARTHCDDDGVCHRHGNGQMALPFMGGTVKETGRMKRTNLHRKERTSLLERSMTCSRGGVSLAVKPAVKSEMALGNIA